MGRFFLSFLGLHRRDEDPLQMRRTVHRGLVVAIGSVSPATMIFPTSEVAKVHLQRIIGRYHRIFFSSIFFSGIFIYSLLLYLHSAAAAGADAPGNVGESLMKKMGM